MTQNISHTKILILLLNLNSQEDENGNILINTPELFKGMLTILKINKISCYECLLHKLQYFAEPEAIHIRYGDTLENPLQPEEHF